MSVIRRSVGETIEPDVKAHELLAQSLPLERSPHPRQKTRSADLAKESSLPIYFIGFQCNANTLAVNG